MRKKELFRAIEENAAFVTLGNLKLIENLTDTFPSEVVFAGGAAKGKLWPQILSDVLGIPVKVPVVKEAAALGTAIAAGVGAGIYTSMEEAAEQFYSGKIHLNQSRKITSYTRNSMKHGKPCITVSSL